MSVGIWSQNSQMLWELITHSSKLHIYILSAFLSKVFDVGDLPVPDFRREASRMESRTEMIRLSVIEY